MRWWRAESISVLITVSTIQELRDLLSRIHSWAALPLARQGSRANPLQLDAQEADIGAYYVLEAGDGSVLIWDALQHR